MIGPFSQPHITHRGIFAFWAIVSTTLLVGGAVTQQMAFSQDGKPPTEQPNAAERAKTTVPLTVSADLHAQVLELVDELRSDQFTLREEASEQLFGLGHLALPVLRSARRKGDDAEQAERLEHIIASLAKQDLESKIKSFLRGGESELENWSELEKWLGDSPRVRELFVDLYREHPYLVESLGGSPQQLSVGLSLVRRRLMERGVRPPETPQRLDLIALLLPMMDPDFDAESHYDILVVSLLQLYPANEFRTDQVFGKPFMRMVAQWMADSDLAVREQVLRLALQWKMDIGLPLALKTLDQDPAPIILCRCMQVIARQGSAEHKVLLSRYLNDPTVVFRKRYVNSRGGDVQVGDVAAASIAFLSSVPVTQIGFAEPAEHEIFGIIFEELVVPLKEASEKDQQDDGEAKGDGEAKDSGKDVDDIIPRFVPGGLGQRPRSWKEIKRLQAEAKLRDAKRIEIHQNAMKLVPQN